MTMAHKRRLTKLEARMAPPEKWNCRLVGHFPGNPEPIARPGERLSIIRAVFPRHFPDEPDCRCQDCSRRARGRYSSLTLERRSALASVTGRRRTGDAARPCFRLRRRGTTSPQRRSTSPFRV
jgi:hypothetical protein